MSNAQNQSGPSRNSSSRPAISISAVIPAGKTIPFPCTGSRFYLPTATAPVQIKPTPGGSFVPYYQGTGQNVPGGFNLLEVQNQNQNDVVVQIICSDSDYIDKRLLNNQVAQPYVVINQGNNFTNYTLGGFILQLPDLSNTQVVDLNGNPWLAISRVSINIQTLANAGTNVNAILFPAFAYPTPQTFALCEIQSVSNDNISYPFVLAASGEFTILTDGVSGLPATLVYEIYQCVAPGQNQLP